MGAQKDYFSHDEFAKLEREEREYLGADVEPPLSGLAISGGGIRSASFGLGVMQALVRANRLGAFDYLSTVSGGGYIGASLTWFLNKGLPSRDGEEHPAGVEPKSFPFGQALPGKEPGGREANAILDYIRQHGDYLIPGGGIGTISLGAVLLRALVMSLFIYGGLLVGFMSLSLVIFDLVHPRLFDVAPVLAPLGELGTPMLALSVLLLVSFALFSILVSTIHGVAIRLGVPSGSYKLRTWSQRTSGMLVEVVMFSALLGAIPLIYQFLDHTELSALISGASTVVGAALGAKQAAAQHDGKESSTLNTLLVWIATALVLFGLALGAWALAFELHQTEVHWIAWLIAGVALVAGWSININYLSLHRMYRDRLMETFLPNLESARTGKWAAASEADKLLLQDICSAPNRRPYHLINTNVVLVDSNNAKYRGRRGDNFVMSRLFCGSQATGWRRSQAWQVSAARGMTLASAMAISGAAANPNAGLAGEGLMPTRVISALMSLLNVRLGYWAPNPLFATHGRNPNYLLPGIPTLLGLGLDEERRMIELTDGGHFENLGVYELIRRRLELIVVSDAGADEDFEFGDFSNTVERVRVDFGVQIELSDEERSQLLPNHEPSQPIDPDKSIKVASRGYAVGSIRYPADPERKLEGKTGTIVLIKTTLVEGLVPDIYSYKRKHPSFPDQTTADQFFDEKQFEAYRELGYGIAKQMLDAGTLPDAS